MTLEITLDDYEKINQRAFSIEFLLQNSEVTEYIVVTVGNLTDGMNFRFIRKISKGYDQDLYPDVITYDFTVAESELFSARSFHKTIMHENNQYELYIAEKSLAQLRDRAVVEID